MPNLIIGSYAIVDGPRGGTYTIRRPSWEVYTCDCPPFRSLGTVSPTSRTCRHLIAYRGSPEEFERVMETPPSRPALATLLASLPRRLQWSFRLFLHERGFYPVLESSVDALQRADQGTTVTWTPPTQTSNTISLWPVSPVGVTVGYTQTVSTIGYYDAGMSKKDQEPPTHWERLITSPFD